MLLANQKYICYNTPIASNAVVKYRVAYEKKNLLACMSKVQWKDDYGKRGYCINQFSGMVQAL